MVHSKLSVCISCLRLHEFPTSISCLTHIHLVVGLRHGIDEITYGKFRRDGVP